MSLITLRTLSARPVFPVGVGTFGIAGRENPATAETLRCVSYKNIEPVTGDEDREIAGPAAWLTGGANYLDTAEQAWHGLSLRGGAALTTHGRMAGPQLGECNPFRALIAEGTVRGLSVSNFSTAHMERASRPCLDDSNGYVAYHENRTRGPRQGEPGSTRSPADE